MSESATPRWALPLLAAGQAEKELTHNEALLLLDMAVQPSVVAVGTSTPPAAPAEGQAWIVGPGATGAWTGKTQAIAGWTQAGWRFVTPAEGTQVWSISDGKTVLYASGSWHLGEVRADRLVVDGTSVIGTQAAAIADPAGGAMIDHEARTTLADILSAMRHHGLIAG
jgi:hypothetical protein